MLAPRRTDEEVMSLLVDKNHPLNVARAAFSGACARLEQAYQQKSVPSSVEMRRMQFEAVEDIIRKFVAAGGTL